MTQYRRHYRSRSYTLLETRSAILTTFYANLGMPYNADYFRDAATGIVCQKAKCEEMELDGIVEHDGACLFRYGVTTQLRLSSTN